MITIALLLADDGRVEEAVELYAAVSSLGFIAKSRFRHDLVGAELAAVAAALPPEVVEAARARGSQADLWATAAFWLDELDSEQ